MKDLKVLGTGCSKCELLAAKASEAAMNLDIEFTLEKVSDLNEIMTYGVMMTPALVIDGKVATVGKVPSLDELQEMLK